MMIIIMIMMTNVIVMVVVIVMMSLTVVVVMMVVMMTMKNFFENNKHDETIVISLLRGCHCFCPSSEMILTKGKSERRSTDGALFAAAFRSSALLVPVTSTLPPDSL